MHTSNSEINVSAVNNHRINHSAHEMYIRDPFWSVTRRSNKIHVFSPEDLVEETTGTGFIARDRDGKAIFVVSAQRPRHQGADAPA